MKTLAIVNNKGGVAKTSSAANIGACMSYLGFNVLLVDSDPQSNLTQHFGYYDVETSIFHAYKSVVDKEKDAKAPLIKHNENLYLLPSSMALKDMEKLLVTQNANQTFLKRLLKPFQESFDYCIIDCPPSLGLLTDNALVACDSLLMPVEAGVFSLNGIKNMVQYFNDIKEDLDLKFELLGVFMTNYDQRQGISEAVRKEVKSTFGEKLFDRVIRTNVAIKDAQANGQDVFTFSKASNAAVDYQELTKQIINRTVYEKAV
jgi:chromosome partitioning protein